MNDSSPAVRHASTSPRHPRMNRRSFLQAGTIGALGLSMANVAALRGVTTAGAAGRPKAVIFLFLTGGASQHDTTGRPYAVYLAEPIAGLRG